MLWGAYCTYFFGSFGRGEITVPTQTDYDSSTHLSYGDIVFDSKASPTFEHQSFENRPI